MVEVRVRKEGAGLSAILLLLPREQVRQKIEAQVDAGQALLDEPIRSDADLRRVEQGQTRWRRYNIDLLKTLFDDEGEISKEFGRVGPAIYAPKPLSGLVQDTHRDIEMHINRLRSILDRLELFQEAPTVVSSSRNRPQPGPAVFIVHGRSHREDAVARVVADLGVEPIILKDELHGGSITLIEKLEREAKRSGYAVVVYTGDDVGKLATSADELTLRARENVVLELGYFIALLGRDRVTILHDPAVTVPSDFAGVGYYPLDELGAWKTRLEGELRLAGMLDRNDNIRAW
jgi:predicted nucleotide-binding protein